MRINAVSKELANENKVVDTSLSKAQYDNLENLDSQFSHFSFFSALLLADFYFKYFLLFLIIVNPFFFSRH